MSDTCSSCSCHDHHDHQHNAWKQYAPGIISFVLLIAGILLSKFSIHFFTGYIPLIWYLIAYLPVGLPVIKEAFEELKKKSIFNEFTLMTTATVGAFCIGEYPEAVAVMLFYSVGELFQHAAVDKAKRNIKSLLDIRPDIARVLRNGSYITVSPAEVSPGEIIQVKAGEKIPLDGTLLSEQGSFNTSALTGESKPKTIRKGETVLAGMLAIDRVVEIRVEKEYADSSLAKIMDMVQNATSRKAKTELLIRRFAKIYTPIVFFLALCIVIIPYFVSADYQFNEWLYKALVFLVISCPCALVISIPLSYFGGIGAASHHGILFKGANYLDILTRVNTIVMDKTGTLTKGVFKVKGVSTRIDETEFVCLVAALEKNSNHPVARAITEFAGNEIYNASNVKEIAGQGLTGRVNDKEIVVGNTKLMQHLGIPYDDKLNAVTDTIVIAAINKVYAGYIIIADELKEDAAQAVKEMHNLNIHTVMLSGDNDATTQAVASSIHIDKAYGGLLPEDKVAHMEALKKDTSNVIAFVGDGINDTPVLALSDVGIAMGGMGTDAAIETADVVIQTDEPSRIITAIKIAKSTKNIVIQNITMAIGVKSAVMLLGALGMASMWQAVFADVGVALLAVLNAVRILKKKF